MPEEVRCHPSFARHNGYGYNFRLPEIAAAVALGELERLDELVAMRRESAKLIDAVVRECRWLVPQKTPEGYVHAWWTYAARIVEDGPDWLTFRRKFVELGGDGFYGCWQPVHKEPFFQELGRKVKEEPQRYPQWAEIMPDYREVSCPVVERIQPRLVQIKTNQFSLGEAKRQAEILGRAIEAVS